MNCPKHLCFTSFVVFAFTPWFAANAATMTISRQVLLPDGKPAVGATVVIHAFNSKNVWENTRVKTDATGAYSVEVEVADEPDVGSKNVKRWFSYQLVDAPNCALEIVSLPRLQASRDSEAKEKSIKLSPEYFVEGRVLVNKTLVNDEDEPVAKTVANAEVFVSALYTTNTIPRGTFPLIQTIDDNLPAELTTKTRDDGSFRLRGAVGLSGSTPILAARGKPYGAGGDLYAGTKIVFPGSHRDIYIPPADKQLRPQPVTIEISPCVDIQGQVLDSATEQLVKNATVSVSAFSSFPVPPPVTTQFQGRFYLGNIPPASSVTIQATAPGYASSVAYFLETPRNGLGDNKLQNVDRLIFRMRKIRKVNVQLRDFSTGKPPIAPLGLWTSLVENGSNAQQEPYRSIVTNDLDAPSVVDGNMTLPLAVGHAQLLLNSSGSYQSSDGYEIVEIDGRDIVDGKTQAVVRDQSEIQTITLGIRRKSGWFVHFPNSDVETLSRYHIQRAEFSESDLDIGRSGWMFFPQQRPEQTLKLRVANDQTKDVVVPWTREFSAQDTDKPIEIALPTTPRIILK